MVQRKKSGERQKEIILAAVKIIDKDGIHALTLQSIANELGISDVALLRHFRSKEEIVEALAQKVFFSTVSENATSASMEANICSLIGGQFAEFEAWPEATAVFFQEEIFREYPAVREWFLVRRAERHRKIVEIVRAGQARGSASQDLDADMFATILMGAMRMAVLEWRDSGRNGSLVEKAKPLALTLTRMVR